MTNVALAYYLTRVMFSVARSLRAGWCESERELDRKGQEFLKELVDDYGYSSFDNREKVQ